MSWAKYWGLLIMEVFLANNTGLGDCLLLNGAARYVASRPDVDHVYLLCIGDHNKFRHISWMYRDNEKISVIPEPAASNGKQARRKMNKRARQYPHAQARIFFWYSNDWYGQMTKRGLDHKTNCWPELFYHAHQAPYTARHEHFYIERDRDRESQIVERLELPSEYAFCSNVSSRRSYPIKPNTNLPIIKPRHTRDDLIFDWMSVIENATEVHTVDTSWFHLIKQMRLDKPKYFYHVRDFSMQNTFTSCYLNDKYDNGWEVLDINSNSIYY